MTQVQTGATFRKGRLLRSATVSAFALSALAGGVVLSGGEAQAACGDDMAGGPVTCSFTDPLKGPFTDTGTLIQPTTPNVPGTKYDLELTGVFWPDPQIQIDTDFNVNGNPYTTANGPISTQTKYSVVKSNGLFDAYTVEIAGSNGTAPPTLFKEIFSDAGFTNLISSYTRTGVGLSPLQILPNQYSQIWIRDTFTPNGGAIDAGFNQLRQTPGPLPILGAGAAFGFSRKLRSRIKAASNA